MVWQKGYKLKNGEYIIEGLLGGGGFGDTYKAIRKSSQQDTLVAIKTPNARIQAKPDFAQHQERFVREAQYLYECSHPHVIPVWDVFCEDQLCFMVMKYIKGCDLEEYVKNSEPLYETQALEYIRQIGEALSCVHLKGFLHRDVKPSNILLCEETSKAILIDFGLAREFVQDETKTHTGIVTEGFGPIEQYQQRAKRGAYTDVYALAATLYFLLTKEIPFPSSVLKHGIPLMPPQAHNPNISDRINNAIMQGMKLYPKDRPQTIKEWFSMLDLESTLNLNHPLKLASAVGIDYTKLQNLLLIKNWHKADIETEKIMLKICKRKKTNSLNDGKIDNFPLKDLLTIDRLWLHYSNKHFGFSIQKQIYLSLGGTKVYNQEIWEAFGSRIGWYNQERWLYYREINYSLSAPTGHLPTFVGRNRGGLSTFMLGNFARSGILSCL